MTVYADDILIGHDNKIDPQTVITECINLFKPIGLDINREKCNSTYGDGEIQFMGQKFNNQTAKSRSSQLLMTAKKCV
ncbi:MAG: hypothetical protein EOM50_09940 [Erysipelotrichia bacterium]|nr:hypothetical protein [Erysipelotrichia bacterium]